MRGYRRFTRNVSMEAIMDEPGGVRVVVVSRGELLLVQHHVRASNELYWCPPGGGRERGETLEEAAVREVYEETGIPVRVLYHVDTSPSSDYALFVAEPLEHREATPTVDLSTEQYLVGAAWHTISAGNPLGPLKPDYWRPLVLTLQRCLAEDSPEHSDS